MTRTSAFVLAVYLFCPPAFSQDLEHRITPGDTIFVTDRQGQETSGTLTHLSSDTLRVLTRSGERELVRSEVGRVEKPDALWDGAAIGAGVFAFGFAGGAGASCSPHCTASVLLSGLVGGAMGGLVGALIDKAIPGRRLVFGVGPDSAFAISPARPTTTSSDLWLRLKDGDRIRVLETSGLETEGKFAASTASSISITDGGRRQEIPVQKVLRVTRRGSHLGVGTLAGLGLGVTTAAAGVCQDGTGRRDYVGCPLAGAVLGAVIGRLIPRHVVVYRAGEVASRSATVVPLIMPILTSTTKAITVSFPFRDDGPTPRASHPVFVIGRAGFSRRRVWGFVPTR